jgi:hypothetical protein
VAHLRYIVILAYEDGNWFVVFCYSSKTAILDPQRRRHFQIAIDIDKHLPSLNLAHCSHLDIPLQTRSEDGGVVALGLAELIAQYL